MAGVAGGVTENKQSTNIDSPPPTPFVCMSIYPQGKPCSDRSRVFVRHDPPVGLVFELSGSELPYVCCSRDGQSSSLSGKGVIDNEHSTDDESTISKPKSRRS
jgi:hypothetical protein